MRYNSTVRLGEPLPIMAEALHNVKVHNAEIDAFLGAHPEYEPVVSALLALLPQKRYMSVMVMAETIRVGNRTCVDSQWHVDGRLSEGNVDHYALVCFGEGDVRTMFYRDAIDAEPIDKPDSINARLAAFKTILGHDLQDENFGYVVPNGVPVAYTSSDFHKGRVAQRESRRVLVRVTASDVIRPRKIKRIG